MSRRAALLCGLLWVHSELLAAPPSGKLEIHNINVQQGNATLLIGPDGTTVLLDAGKNGQGAVIADYLLGIGIRPEDGIDVTVASHMDSDHVGGFDEIVESGYDVRRRSFFNGSGKSTGTIRDYHRALAGTTAGPAIAPDPGEVVELGRGATLTFVAVGGEVIGRGLLPEATSENDQTIALIVQYGGFDYVWAGDLGGGDDDRTCTGRRHSSANVETPVARAITPGGAWPLLGSAGVDVMHVSHHGSESSTNSDWMDLLRPEVALLSVGAGQPRAGSTRGATWWRACCALGWPA